jgi:hypothetical protein
MIRETADACYDNETCPTNAHSISNIDENCVVLGYYAASSGDSLPTFRDNLSVPSSKVKNLENSSLAEFFNRIRILMGIFWSSLFSLRLRLLGFFSAVDNRGVTVAIVVTIIITYLVFTNFLPLEDRTDRMPRNVGTELSLLAA